MKQLQYCLLIILIAISNLSQAKVSCVEADQKLVVDPAKKKLVITKNGTPHRFKILNPANNGFQIFGSNTSAFETEGGYVVGIKDTKKDNRKDISVFKGGEVVAHFEACTEKN